MSNTSEIKGDRNIVLQETKRTKISVGNKTTKHKKNRTLKIISIVVAILGLIITIVINWNLITNFLK